MRLLSLHFLACPQNQPRPPPGELTEAALEHFITPRVRDEVWELLKVARTAAARPLPVGRIGAVARR
jgi:hypothetical protein